MTKKDRVFVVVLFVIFSISLLQYFVLGKMYPLKAEEGVFVEGIVGKVHSINPVLTDFNETDKDISQMVFSGLIRFDPIKKNFFPDLAESFERSRNGLTYTFKIRQNVVWHDGKPLSADDVIFTFRDVVQSPNFRNPILRDVFDGITVAQSTSGDVIFNLPKPNSYFISVLTVGILPKHLLENVSAGGLEKSSFNTHPVGTGPYRVTKVNTEASGDYVELTSFENYYGAPPSIKTIRIFTFNSEEALLAQSSALNGVARIPKVTAFNDEIVKKDRFTLYRYSLNQFTALYFNTQDSLLNESKVRRSLLLALNKDALVGPGEERIDTLNVARDTKNFLFQHNPEVAQKALAEVNYKKGSDGIWRSNKDEKFAITLLVHEKIPTVVVENVKKDWEKFGIEVLVETSGGQEFTKKVSERRYQALLIRQNLGYNRDVYPLFHSSQGMADIVTSGETEEVGTPSEPGLNFANFKSFRADAITEAIRKESDAPSKEKLLTELSNIITEESPVIFLSTPVYSYALTKNLSAFPTDSMDFHSDRFTLTPYLTFL